MGVGPIWGISSLDLSSLGLSEQIERPMPIPILLNSLARFGNNPHLQQRMQLYEATDYMHPPQPTAYKIFLKKNIVADKPLLSIRITKMNL